MKNVVFQAMEMAKESREFYIKTDSYFADVLKPSNGDYSINLGRQVGHTTSAVEFANKYPDRCIFVTTKEQWVKMLRNDYNLTQEVPIINISGASVYEQLNKDIDNIKGRDIIIVDMYSFLDKKYFDKLEGLKYALVEATNLPIFAYYKIQ